MTQGAVAAAVGVSGLMVVSNWERGVSSPSDENLLALARVFDRSLAWFYTEHKPNPAPVVTARDGEAA